MKQLITLLIGICLNSQVMGQCENVEIVEDRFERTKTYYTKSFLILSDDLKINISKNHELITLRCWPYDSEGNYHSVGVNAGLHFLFTDGTTLKLYNECLKASSDDRREPNNIGCIHIDLFDSEIMEKDYNCLKKLSTKKIESIRVMDVENNNWDFDLSESNQSYIKDAINCMMN